MLRLLSAVLAPAVLFAGCNISFGGAGDVSPPPPLADAAVEAGTDAPSSVQVTQKGKLVDLSTNVPIVGAKITAGVGTATTDAQGKYEVAVNPTTAFNMRAEKAGYFSLTEQETLVKASIDLGKTRYLSEDTAILLTATLNGYIEGLGVLSVAIEKQGCPDEGGATLEFTVNGAAPPSSAKMVYVSGNAPDSLKTNAQSGSFPHAVFYNLPTGVPVAVTVKHPTCTMVPFPIDKALAPDGTGTVTYTSATLQTAPGKALSFLRVFLK